MPLRVSSLLKVRGRVSKRECIVKEILNGKNESLQNPGTSSEIGWGLALFITSGKRSGSQKEAPY
jgi:hypothetical protein